MGLLGAFVAVAAALGVSAVGNRVPTASAQIPAGITVGKTCAAATVAVGAATTCTVTVANPTAAAIALAAAAPGPAIVITTNSAAGSTGLVTLQQGTSSFTSTNAA